MKLKKAVTVILSAVLSCALAVTPVMADEVDDLKEQKQQTESEVENLQLQLNGIISKITELERQLVQTGEEITRTQDDLAEAEKEEESQYTSMKLRIKYMYESGTGMASLERVLSSGNMSGLLSEAEYSQQVHEYDRRKLTEYAETVQKVRELKTSLQEKQNELEQSQTEFTARQEELDATLTDKSAELAGLNIQIDDAVRKAAEEAAKKAAEKAKQKAAEEAVQKAAAEAADTQSKSEDQDKKPASGTGSSTQNNSGNNTGNNSGNSGNNTGNNSGNSGNGNTSTQKPDRNEEETSTPSSPDPEPEKKPSQSTPVYNKSKGEIIVQAAYSQLGVPYVWGGSEPGVGLDCSGLVQYCYSQAGISIPRYSGDIMSEGTIVDDPQPGDICWKPGHVAIYIGNGQMIEAPHTGAVVRVASVRATYYIRY